MASIRSVYRRGTTAGGSNRRPVAYEVRYRDAAGKQRTKGGFRRKRDAAMYVVALEAGRHTGSLVPHSEGGVRFDVVAVAWALSIQGRRKPQTIVGYEKLLASRVLPAFHARMLGCITVAGCDSFVH